MDQGLSEELASLDSDSAGESASKAGSRIASEGFPVWAEVGHGRTRSRLPRLGCGREDFRAGAKAPKGNYGFSHLVEADRVLNPVSAWRELPTPQ